MCFFTAKHCPARARALANRNPKWRAAIPKELGTSCCFVGPSARPASAFEHEVVEQSLQMVWKNCRTIKTVEDSVHILCKSLEVSPLRFI